MKRLLNELWSLIRKPWFIVPLCLTAVIGYGYVMGHLSVGIDDLQVPMYVNDLFTLRTGRLWQWVLLRTVLSIPNGEYALAALSVLAMLLAAALLSLWLRRAAEDKLHPACYTVFACVFISYPLIAEIWIFNSIMVVLPLGYICIGLALMAMDAFLRQRKAWTALGAVLALWVGYSLYEPLCVAYVMGVFAYLGLRAAYGQEREARLGTMMKNGLWCALVLALAVGVNALAVGAILRLAGYEPIAYAASLSGWTAEGAVAEKLRDVLRSIIAKFGLFGLFYFPIGLMQACAAFTGVSGAWYAIRQKRPAVLLPTAGMLVTVLAIPLALCKGIEYRNCQELPLFCALAVTAALQGALTHWKREWLKRAATAACVLLCLAQAASLSSQFRLDYRCHEENVRVIEEIMSQVHRETDYRHKPLVFMGKYAMASAYQEGSSIRLENLRWEALFPELSEGPGLVYYKGQMSQRLISWLPLAFANYGGPINGEFYRYLEYLGYDDLIRCTNQQYLDACQMSPGLPWYPEAGYMTETEAFILVKLGPWFEEYA